MSEYLLRIVVLLATVILAALSWFAARRSLAGWYRLPLDYALGCYTLTYGIGCMVLFLMQEAYLDRYYNGSLFIPAGVSYWQVLLVGILPYFVLPWTVVVGAGFLARAGAVRSRPRAPLKPEAVYGGVAVVSLLSIALVAPIAPTLVGNALGDLVATTSQSALYAQRQEVFQSVAVLQGGVIYSVLPAGAAIILFWPSKRPWVNRSIGGALAVFALLLNLGMFQIGPTLTFLLTCVFCYFALSAGKPNPLAVAGALVLGGVVLGLYSLLKTSSSQLSQIELFVMRLPIPLPYLIQMSEQIAPPGSNSYNLPAELGEYMFPQLRTAQRFVAMPQPGFVSAWFSFGVAYGVAALVFAGGMVVVFGRLFAESGFGRKVTDGRLVLWSVVAAPALYYAFQVDIYNLFTSSYSITFCLIPVVAILALNLLLSNAPNDRPRPVRQLR